MSTVIFETEKAAFKFDLQDVSASFQDDSSLGSHKDNVELAMFLELSSDPVIDIPKDKKFFRYITLDLLKKGKGSALCHMRKERYPATDLQSHPIGAGENPLRLKIRRKGGILKRIFRKKIRWTGMMGGKGYQCPEGHELISMVTWVT